MCFFLPENKYFEYNLSFFMKTDLEWSINIGFSKSIYPFHFLKVFDNINLDIKLGKKLKDENFVPRKISH